MTKRSFKILIILQWVLVIIGVLSLFVTESLLPPELQSYLQAQADAPLTSLIVIQLVIDVVFGALALAVSVGLFRFKKWAKDILPMVIVAGFALMPMSGATVESGWSSAVFYLISMIDGFILALVCFSPFGELFKAKSDV